MRLIWLVAICASCGAPLPATGTGHSTPSEASSADSSLPGPTSSPTPTTARPTLAPASPSAPSFCILVDLGQVNSYNLSLVSTDGIVAASARAARRTVITVPSPNGPETAIDLPYVGATRTRVYYLDGDATVRWLDSGGNSQTVAATIPGTATAHASFAVSPDDSRIAVSVIDYASQQPSVRLLVGPLGGKLTQIFFSTSDFVWPIGWHAGDLVLATQNRAPFAQSEVLFNPYAARSFHLADPANANRLGTIGNPEVFDGCWPTGVLTVAGTACYISTAFGGQSGGYAILNWLGNRYLQPVAASWNATASVAPAPAATSVIVCCEQNRDYGRFLLSGEGGPSVTPLTGTRSEWACWIDQNHVLSGTADPAALGQSAMMDLNSRHVVPVGGRGFCAGVLPTDLG